MEVMGLMLGEFVDDYTVSLVEVVTRPATNHERRSRVSTSLPCLSRERP